MLVVLLLPFISAVVVRSFVSGGGSGGGSHRTCTIPHSSSINTGSFAVRVHDPIESSLSFD